MVSPETAAALAATRAFPLARAVFAAATNVKIDAPLADRSIQQAARLISSASLTRVIARMAGDAPIYYFALVVA